MHPAHGRNLAIIMQSISQAICQLPERFPVGKLRFVVRVRNRAGRRPSPRLERDVVCRHDLADVAKARVEKTLSDEPTPLAMMSAAAYEPVMRSLSWEARPVLHPRVW